VDHKLYQSVENFIGNEYIAYSTFINLMKSHKYPSPKTINKCSNHIKLKWSSIGGKTIGLCLHISGHMYIDDIKYIGKVGDASIYIEIYILLKDEITQS